MIIHRFTFARPVQIPGRAPVTTWEPAARNNTGYTAHRTPDGWLFVAPPGTNGLCEGGQLEAAALGIDPSARLCVFVPHADVTVHAYGLVEDDAKGPTRAPTLEYSERLAAPPAPPAPPPPPVDAAPTPAAPAPHTPTPRRPRGMRAAPPPPPPGEWVDD